MLFPLQLHYADSTLTLPCTETTALSSAFQIILRNWALCSSASLLLRNKTENNFLQVILEILGFKHNQNHSL